MMHIQQLMSAPRHIFNPKDPAHVESLAVFLKTGNWGDVQFHCELPFNNVPACVMTKMLCSMLNVVPETLEERTERISKMHLTKVSEESLKEKRRRHARAIEIIFENLSQLRDGAEEDEEVEETEPTVK